MMILMMLMMIMLYRKVDFRWHPLEDCRSQVYRFGLHSAGSLPMVKHPWWPLRETKWTWIAKFGFYFKKQIQTTFCTFFLFNTRSHYIYIYILYWYILCIYIDIYVYIYIYIAVPQKFRNTGSFSPSVLFRFPGKVPSESCPSIQIKEFSDLRFQTSQGPFCITVPRRKVTDFLSNFDHLEGGMFSKTKPSPQSIGSKKKTYNIPVFLGGFIC